MNKPHRKSLSQVPKKYEVGRGTAPAQTKLPTLEGSEKIVIRPTEREPYAAVNAMKQSEPVVTP